MLKAFMNLFKIPELRKRFLFTIGILIVFRIGVQIPVPGINLMFLTPGGDSGTLEDFLNLFSGGARENASIFSLGVMPYITASIVGQLLKAVIPSVARMLKEGPEGRKKFQQYTRLGTVLVTIIQGVVYARGLVEQGRQTPNLLTIDEFSFVIIFTLAVTAGTLILMWMGEQIQERGIGNGISLIIMAGIIARLPHSIYQMIVGVNQGGDQMTLIIVLLLFVVVIGLVVFEEQGLRKIPIQYANRMTAGGARGSQVSFLPFKVNPTGVIPIIFASSILIVPATLGQWLGGTMPVFKVIAANMNPGQLWYSVAYFVFIIFFAYFYTDIEYNPHDISENLRKSGGFVPGVRPGPQTEQFLSFTLSRITLPGSLFLGMIALMPNFVISALEVPSGLGYLMGGTSLLIMVGVALDTLKQMESHLMMHHMDGFITKVSLKK